MSTLVSALLQAINVVSNGVNICRTEKVCDNAKNICIFFYITDYLYLLIDVGTVKVEKKFINN